MDKLTAEEIDQIEARHVHQDMSAGANAVIAKMVPALREAMRENQRLQSDLDHAWKLLETSGKVAGGLIGRVIELQKDREGNG